MKGVLVGNFQIVQVPSRRHFHDEYIAIELVLIEQRRRQVAMVDLFVFRRSLVLQFLNFASIEFSVVQFRACMTQQIFESLPSVGVTRDSIFF